MKTITITTINQDQRLFVIPCGNDGFTCLGFDVCHKRSLAMAKELNLTLIYNEVGTMDAYRQYEELIDRLQRLNAETGFFSQTELNPKLIGLEGK